MRVIAGELRGRKLYCPRGGDIRPTADRMREAVFSILGDRVQDARVLDLFAGTGALAIEALSRGASCAVLVDRSRTAVKVAQRNLAACRLEARARVICWDIGRNLNCLPAGSCTFDLVFMDPPYRQDALRPALEALLASGAMAREALVVVEHAARSDVRPPAGLRVVDRRRYGRGGVTFLAAERAPKPML